MTKTTKNVSIMCFHDGVKIADPARSYKEWVMQADMNLAF
jgi:hypothetical protein